MIYIVMLSIFLLVFTIVSLLILTLTHKERPIDKLKYFEENYVIIQKNEGSKKNPIRPFKVLSNLIPNLKFNKNVTEKMQVELMKADIPVTVEELLIIKILSSSVLAILAYSIFNNLIIIMIVFIIIWNIPKIIIANRKKERIKVFGTQLNEGIMIISNSLKAGYSFNQAIAVVTEEMKDPFSKEFKKLLKEMSLGISEEDSIKNLLSRMECEDLRLIMNAILIQKDVGGNLSEILDNISETIRERQKIKEELRALTAQGKLSGIIVMLIPIFLSGIIYLINRDYMIVLFTTPLGLVMLGAAILNQLLGFAIIRKIINIDM